MQILRDLFANTIKAAETLGVDEDFRRQLSATARARLAPNQIGSAGQLQEWLEDWDMKAGEQHHRHVSHLYGLYPGRDIHRRDTPELAAGVKKSLEMRGDKATGWATAWRLCLWTHLGDGDHAFEILKHLLSPGLTYPEHVRRAPAVPDRRQLRRRGGHRRDARCKAAPARSSCSRRSPKAWPAGSVRGLRARGGFQVDLAWKDGKLVEGTLTAVTGGSTPLRYGATTRRSPCAKGETYRWNGQ